MTAQERREQLLDVTKELVGERGFHEVSIEAVARRAGITRPVVYDHYPDLGSLLEAMLDRETVRALTQLTAILPASTAAPEPREALLAALGGYLEAVRADPVTWRLVLMPPDGAPEMLRERIRRGRDAVIRALADVVAGSGLGPGRSSPDPVLTARLLSAVADESARLALTDPGSFPVRRLLDHARWVLDQLA
jgi:AcrR family transcriptional regulator